MTWGSFVQLLIALPKIIAAVNEFVKQWEKRAKAQAEIEHQKALEELKNAQTEQEKKDAFDKYLDKP